MNISMNKCINTDFLLNRASNFKGLAKIIPGYYTNHLTFMYDNNILEKLL